VKLSNNPNGTARCLKYRFNDLKLFTEYLDKKWQSWKWYNVYANQGELKGQQLGSFTKNNKPKNKTI
jgi:hypothetical protein